MIQSAELIPYIFLDNCKRLIEPNSGIEFKGDDIRRLNNHCVYMFMRAGKAIYIGCSLNGLERVFKKAHEEARKARQECDSLQVWFCKDLASARELERYMISELRPEHNIRKCRMFIVSKTLDVKQARVENA